MAILEIKGLTKSYDLGKTKALDAVDLVLETGKISAFIGHNGAGKTTLLKCVTGILNFEEGEILFLGENILTNPLEAKKHLVYVPDNPDIYDSITGLTYLNFIADIYRIGVEERRAAIERYAELFELSDQLGNIIGSYSHGMQQKLVLISALMRKPKLLILDEPFVGLDPKATFTIKKLMREMCDAGCAVFFSTHVLEVAEKLCDYVAVIQNGKIIATGTMQEIKGDSSLEEVFLKIEGFDGSNV